MLNTDGIKNIEISDNKYIFNASSVLEAENIIIYGSGDYFRENINKLDKRIVPKYIFIKGSNQKVYNSLKVITTLDEIKQMNNHFVLIALGDANNISNIAKELSQSGICFDHLDFYTSYNRIKLQYLKALERYHYLDVENNEIQLEKECYGNIFIVKENANNARIIINKVSVQKSLSIKIMGNGACCFIGDNTTIYQAIIIINTYGKVEIGKDCMFSHTIQLAQSDQHHIFNLKTGKRINRNKNIIIGNHVWVGRETELLGGAEVGDNCIIGARTVTSGKFKHNCIIAGCPGAIIRENIIWARDMLKSHDYEYIWECEDQAGLKYIESDDEIFNIINQKLGE